jgi:hypothetical protein
MSLRFGSLKECDRLCFSIKIITANYHTCLVGCWELGGVGSTFVLCSLPAVFLSQRTT